MKKVIALACCLFSLQAIAQDIIKLKTGEEVKAKITVVSDDEIQYKEWDYQDGPDFKVSVKKVALVRFQNGREMKFEDSDLMIGAPDPKVLAKKDVIKVAFLSPLFGRTVLGYEHVQRFGLHWEGELGIIGLGKDRYGNRERGIWIAGGPKLLLRKETYMKGERYLHFLQGTYVRPEVHIEYYSGIDKAFYYNNAGVYTSRDVDYSNTTLGLILNFGKQWFVGDAVTIDLFGGIGMSSVNTVSDRVDGESLSYYSYNYGSRGILSADDTGDGELGLALKGGFKIGLAF